MASITEITFLKCRKEKISLEFLSITVFIFSLGGGGARMRATRKGFVVQVLIQIDLGL